MIIGSNIIHECRKSHTAISYKYAATDCELT